jgi:hypothetical protein
MEFKREMVAIECANCRARYRAVLADSAPSWDQKCVECDTPFGTVRGKYVRCLFAPSDLSRPRRWK